MQALLLAGGRFQDGSVAAARRVAGLSLLERALFVAHAAGAQGALVLAEAALHPQLQAALRRRDLPLRPRFVEPAAAADLAGVGDGMLVMRADVVYDRAASAALREAAPGTLLTSGRPEDRPPPRGAERLSVGACTWIGLAHLSADAVRALAAGIARDPARGDLDCLEEELRAGRVAPVPAAAVTWQLVRDEADARAAHRLLMKSLGKPQDGWVSRHLNRPVSTAVSGVLVDYPVHPNAVTVLVFLISTTACALVAFGDAYVIPLLATVLVHVGSILDGCDGELARLRYQQSLVGAWMDNVGDDLTMLFYASAAAINLWRHSGATYFVVVGVANAVCMLVAMGVTYSYLISIGSGTSQDFPTGVKRARDVSGWWPKLVGFLAYLSKRDTTNFILVGCAAAGLLAVSQALLFIGGAITMVVFVRRFRELRRPPAAGAAAAEPRAGAGAG